MVRCVDALVHRGACSHAPGITTRADRADTQLRQALEKAFYHMGDDIRAIRPDALVVVAAEHFANFFMDNMPAFAMGMADAYQGPIEGEAFLRIARTTGFEIRTFIAAAAAARDAKGTIDFCEPIPIFVVSCTTARLQLEA